MNGYSIGTAIVPNGHNWRSREEEGEEARRARQVQVVPGYPKKEPTEKPLYSLYESKKKGDPLPDHLYKGWSVNVIYGVAGITLSTATRLRS